jgi:type VI secretion system protein ImpM
MPAGFFGKLPAKRDFVAYQTTRPFLDMWEPWLQASVATARQTLGERWPEAYNRMPIWRFWLGAQFSGEAVIGALMASVDGVGRAFPLAVFCGEGQSLLPPPEIEANGGWCEAAEHALLGALAPDKAFEDFARDVDALPAPALQSPVEEMALAIAARLRARVSGGRWAAPASSRSRWRSWGCPRRVCSPIL